MKIDLLKLVEYGGCSSKIPARQLEEMLSMFPVSDDSNILVGIETHDDAGVYRLTDEIALVLTTDFFPPVCSDPYEFGQIAAANSISDVYAMGGDPVLALNIIMFPSSKLPMEAYSDILRGGLDKAAEAGVKIIGGHSIDDSPPKYGLAVTGFVHPDKIVTNSGAKPGDLLILTKPVGTGIINSAIRMNMASDSDVDASISNMKLLNKSGAEVMKKYGTRGATDITGFGLAGHALKMARASNVSIEINTSKIPLIGSVYDLTDAGCIPGASFRNLEYAEPFLSVSSALDYNLRMIAFDAQTSGGLLICADPGKADEMLTDLHNAGLKDASVIGFVTEEKESYLNLS